MSIEPLKDKSHQEHLEKWAHFVRTNPEWKNIHTQFINAQITMAQDFIIRLSRQPGGKEKIIRLYNIKNFNGYQNLLGE